MPKNKGKIKIEPRMKQPQHMRSCSINLLEDSVVMNVVNALDSQSGGSMFQSASGGLESRHNH